MGRDCSGSSPCSHPRAHGTQLHLHGSGISLLREMSNLSGHSVPVNSQTEEGCFGPFGELGWAVGSHSFKVPAILETKSSSWNWHLLC